ncbi:BTB domain-containing protein [Aphelenchoides fujianensis]|nr:BTB domain-containing protein [Aphelenchoides fujianensis]
MVIDFSEPTHLRQFELVVDGRSLFINPHYLAEISPYFHALCFANFRETHENRVEMEDISYEDMLELLRCVCSDENFTVEHRITADNFAALIYLSSRLLLQNLRRELERIVADSSGLLDTEDVPLESMVEIFVEATQADFSETALGEMARRVGKFKKEDVVAFLTKSFPPEVHEPLLQRCQPYFYEAPTICTTSPRSSYNWNQMHIRTRAEAFHLQRLLFA